MVRRLRNGQEIRHAENMVRSFSGIRSINPSQYPAYRRVTGHWPLASQGHKRLGIGNRAIGKTAVGVKGVKDRFGNLGCEFGGAPLG